MKIPAFFAPKFAAKQWLPAIALGCTLTVPCLADDTTAKEKEDSKKTEYKADSERFDHTVREDLFAGFEGDEEALKRGMQACEDALKEKPDHAEALVWRGAARIFISGEAFQKGDFQVGMKNWTSGLEDVDKAVELEPDNIGVLIPRAAVLLPAGRSAPKAMGLPLLHRVRKDFERTYERQKDMLDEIGEHPLGELRMGLADVYRALGEGEKSTAQLEAVIKELPDTAYSSRATKWLAAPKEKKLAHSCIGCHSS
ncbi:MAG: hypothetical protein AAGG44_07790 [Planctomycetota bacterium]